MTELFVDKIKYISYKQINVIYSLIYRKLLLLGLEMGIDLWGRMELP